MRKPTIFNFEWYRITCRRHYIAVEQDNTAIFGVI